MAVDFRCEKCGKLLSIESTADSRIKCPYCKAKVTVPASIAAMPRPQVPPGAGGPPPPPQQQAEQQEEELVHHPDALMGVMAAVMPWVISLFFHVGILVILGFLTIVMIQTQTAEGDATIPDAELSDDPGGRVNPGKSDPDMDSRSMEMVKQDQWAQRDSTIAQADMGKTDNKVTVIGLSGGSGGGSSAKFGLSTGGSGAGPKSRFFGTGGNAYHVVYVVDRSGSMLPTLDLVKHEMRRSISRLSAQQSFHIIFFAWGEPKELPMRSLMYATEQNKKAAAAYLRTVQAKGKTEPIPAVRRAFSVLARPKNKRKGKLVYLLTDGEFVDNAATLAAIRKLNPRGEIHINTILHKHESQPAIDVLRKIAAQNGGKFKFVEGD